MFYLQNQDWSCRTHVKTKHGWDSRQSVSGWLSHAQICWWLQSCSLNTYDTSSRKTHVKHLFFVLRCGELEQTFVTSPWDSSWQEMIHLTSVNLKTDTWMEPQTAKGGTRQTLCDASNRTTVEQLFIIKNSRFKMLIFWESQFLDEILWFNMKVKQKWVTQQKNKKCRKK